MILFRVFKIGSKALALACGACLLMFAQFSVAEQAQATATFVMSAPGGDRYGSDPVALVVDYKNEFYGHLGPWQGQRCDNSYPNSGCNGTPGDNYADVFVYSATVGYWQGPQRLYATLTCPDSTWTLNGSTCTRPDQNCKDGQYAQNGVCKCESGAQIGNDGTCCPMSSDGAPSMQWCYVQNASATSCDSSNGNGCGIRCSNVTFQLPKGDSVVLFPALAMGQACKYTGSKSVDSAGGGPLSDQELDDVKKATKTPEAVKTPAGCLSAGMGYVTSGNGTTSCVSSGDNGEVKKVTNTQDTKTDSTGTKQTDTVSETSSNNGTIKTVETQTTTSPDGSKVKTTTTVTKNPDGTVATEKVVEWESSTGTKTTQSTEKSNDTTESYCSKNPNASMCKEQSDFCKDHPDRAGCVEMGEPTDGDVSQLQTEHRGETMSIIPFNTSETCPADIALPRGMSFSWGPICTGASWLKPVILAFAWLSAGLIIVGAFRES